MAEDQTDQSQKTEEPSRQRLDQARRQGDVAKSQDVPSVMALAAAAGVLIIGGGWIARSMAANLLPFIDHPQAFDLRGNGGVEVMKLALGAAAPVMTVIAAVAVAGAGGNLIQHGFLWSPSKLAPQMSKLSPLEGFKKIFGLDGLVQFLKSLAKIAAVAIAAWMVLKPRVSALGEMPALDIAAILPLSAEILRALTIAVLVVMGVVAGADWFWQRHRFMARMRMSREELKQDNKDSEGDPHIRARQKQIRQMRAKRRMIQNVPKATLIVMNPTHYAVALRYVQGETAAPICVAKGLDTLALKIRAVAEINSIPVVEDPPLARALYAAVDVDATIPRQHYEAVAKIIGFILSARRPRAAGRL